MSVSRPIDVNNDELNNEEINLPRILLAEGNIAIYGFNIERETKKNR